MIRVLTASFATATLLFASDVQAQLYYPYAYSYSPSSYYYSSSIRPSRFVASPAFGVPAFAAPSVGATAFNAPSLAGYTLIPVASVDQKTPSYSVYSPGLGFVGWLQLINNVWQFVENKGQGGGSDPTILQEIKDKVASNEVKVDKLQQDVTTLLQRIPAIPAPPLASPAVAIPAPGAPEASGAAADATDRLSGIVARLTALQLDKKK